MKFGDNVIQFPSVTDARTINWGEGEADGISVGQSWITGNWTSTIYVAEQENCTEFWVPAAGSGEVQVPCAVPTNLRIHDRSAAGLTFTVIYKFDSSTGKLSDLANCRIGEYVTYGPPPGPDPYPWPDPPFAGDQARNPTDKTAGSAEFGEFTDNHRVNEPL